MLNIDAFIDRLEQLMENHQLNAASFSEKIGVQRSSLSHILSRRNKPSLDFILKIQAQFDEVDFDWLLLGTSKKVSFAADDLKKQESATEKKEGFKEENIQLENQSNSLKNRPSELLKIVEFYKDGTFDVFLPKS